MCTAVWYRIPLGFQAPAGVWMSLVVVGYRGPVYIDAVIFLGGHSCKLEISRLVG